jgi:dihydrofolate reductase
MRKIFLFINTSLDGYFEAPGHDLSWATASFDAFSPEQGAKVDTILLGHNTYDMMKQYWPTPKAMQDIPQLAKFMNETQKIVPSHRGFQPDWKYTTVLTGDVPAQIKHYKSQPGKSMLMLGSNTFCVSLIEAELMDEFQIMVNPVAIGKGTSLFTGLSRRVPLELTNILKQDSGATLLTFKPDYNRPTP